VDRLSLAGVEGACPPVVVRTVSHEFAGQPALQSVSFQIGRGELLALVGPNGAGKSTLLRVMLGLLAPTAGEAQLFCHPALSFHDWQRVAYVPQQAVAFDAQFPVRARELVLLGRIPNRRLARRFSAEDREAAEWAMEVCGVEELGPKRAGDLSGGQKQRVLIAKALARKPELLLMDEPTAGVDAESQERLFDLIDHLNAKLGVTVALVTHDHGIVRERVQRVLALNVKIEFAGSPADYEIWEQGRARPRLAPRSAEG
jgi:zinc transport system ATP-binding protein